MRLHLGGQRQGGELVFIQNDLPAIRKDKQIEGQVAIRHCALMKYCRKADIAVPTFETVVGPVAHFKNVIPPVIEISFDKAVARATGPTTVSKVGTAISAF